MKKSIFQQVQILTLTAWITLFVAGTDLFVVSPLLPFIADQFSIDPLKAGWMVTAFSLMYALGAPGFGMVSIDGEALVQVCTLSINLRRD